MNKAGDNSGKNALRSQKQPRAHQVVQKKKKEATSKDAQSVSSKESDSGKEVKPVKRPGKVSAGVPAECPRSPGAHRKLSDASNASEDLSKDSGCLSGKLSSSDSSSEISDCPSETNKNECLSSDAELSWTDGRVYARPIDEAAGKPCVRAHPGAAAARLDFFSSGDFADFMMGETTEYLVRELEDLRSENEYLKDELEELRCEMLEMRDVFQEEEAYQLQELRSQLEQANKTCRILQYRLHKAERRSIRVAQTGQVDGELVRTLEHDIKVAKNVSLRLYNELEAVQKKNSQLDWENERLREKTQELEVAKQVLQTEVEKSRESSLKRKTIRPTVSKAEKRLSQQIEDDSADLKCQLHFAKEELALMCKKLTKLVSESKAMREELPKYHSAYGDINATQSSEGKQNSAHAREAEIKVHLKLVEEEATLLSRRIVELEVENRGLRTEMSDLREKIGGGDEEEESLEVLEKKLLLTNSVKDGEGSEQSVERGCTQYEHAEVEESKGDVQTPLICSQSQTEGMITSCNSTQEGLLGGEWDPSDGQGNDENKNLIGSASGLTQKDYKTLLALRDHSCILSSAIQLLTSPPRNGHCSSPLCTFDSLIEVDPKCDVQQMLLPGPLNEALELLQTMLLAFTGRLETLLMGEDFQRASLQKDGHVWDSCKSSAESDRDARNIKESSGLQECAEEFHVTDTNKGAKSKPPRSSSSQWDLMHRWGDQKVRLSLQILWILHQQCQIKGEGQDGKEGRDQIKTALQQLLQDLGAELQNEQTEAKDTRGRAAECAVSAVFDSEGSSAEDRSVSLKCTAPSKRTRRPSPHEMKNWRYLSQEAALLDRDDPVKMWDHPIMPVSFPDLDFEQIFTKRSHTAPEKTACRIYYSPPSARRVQLAQLTQSLVTERESANTLSPWCMPPTSFSPLCLGSTSNLSDDVKEMTAGWSRGVSRERWVDVACSGTQTHTRPQMVSVGLQTDAAQGPFSVRTSPSRVLTSSLVSARAHHISTSLDGVTGRMERLRSTTASPKLYRRHSAGSTSAIPQSHTFSSSSSLAASRERALWNLPHQSHTGMAWTRQTHHRASGGSLQSAVSSERSGRITKASGKSAAANRYGLVTEFLRRVSGRADKPASGSGQKTKGGMKNLERVPTRHPAIQMHRNDSVTRIVNQRFMKQRDEASRAQKGSGLTQSVRHSLSAVTADDGNDCSSSSTLTFCFARPSRTNQRQLSPHNKVHRHSSSPPVSIAADSSCE
ncbi:uncharacterized protein si:ch211-197l9.2 [Thalassophryne amazonica]|uniref:uncharacterized protein si:ch211-197l9.2 n=1 Tax=Thalassophryne amazonica TaxID=390379 RepID=UPI0014725E7F|nr:uncharacterized protein si:ch211-197l9.2 [Thalassophryne amazonica]